MSNHNNAQIGPS